MNAEQKRSTRTSPHKSRKCGTRRDQGDNQRSAQHKRIIPEHDVSRANGA
uniref:Uncharacterized protein n=1 Tax=Globisporangium ultimum (strain ATCC 200006 / CBS 805.95 / DAOM BR144) TaxID=431595 RepID=K3X1J7_GLOUD